jgi:tetratricopeptide (TPR) repeat protein
MSDALLWNEIGNIYLKIGSLDESIAAYKKAIELDPDAGWPYCNLGRAYFLMGEYGHALFQFRKSIQLMDTPETQAEVWVKIGDAYRALKDIENAIQAYKKADDLDMGTPHLENNSTLQPGGIAKFREMMKTTRLNPDPNLLASDHPLTEKESESTKVNQSLEKGLQVKNFGIEKIENLPTPERQETKPNPRLDNTSLPAGDKKYSATFDGDMENTHLPKEIFNSDIPNLNETVKEPQEKGKPESEPEKKCNPETGMKQEELQDIRINGHPKNNPGIDDLEEILAKVNIYENITRVNPTNDRAWDTLGKLYKSLGRYKDAIGAYQKAIEMAPDKEVYYYYLGLLYSVEQQHEAAVLAFQFVLRKNPDYVLAHSALAGVYHRMGHENKANHHIATALPKMNNESAYNRACFYAICGDLDLAVELLRLALKNKDTTIEWIKSDPDLDPVRTDQRYQLLITEKDPQPQETTNENFFASELDGKPNRLLPILNRSLAR